MPNINTIEDLAAITGTGAITGTYTLLRSLDFNDNASYANPANKATYTTGSGWPPIGLAGTSWFAGIFNGQGYVIKNLYTNGRDSAGLFGIVDNCTIENLGVINARVNPTVTTNHRQAGALIAGIDPVGTVLVRNCYSRGGIVSADDRGGGLIGVAHMYSTCNLIIEDCYAQTDVEERGTFMDGQQWGGFMGSTTTVSTGGSIIIRRCYSTGKVTTGATTDTGGFMGLNQGSAVITDCYWDTQTSGKTTSVGGTGKTTAEMKKISTYTNWSIAHQYAFTTQKWWIGADHYPQLASEHQPVPSRAPAPASLLKVRESTFNLVPHKVYLSGAWRYARPKRFDGSVWKAGRL